MDYEKFVLIQRKGVTITRKRVEVQSYIVDGWKEVVPEVKKPMVHKKKEGNYKK